MRAAKMKERPTFQLMCQTDVQSIYHMQMPRWLFSDPRYCEMSLDAKVTYTFLLNRFQLSRKNGWVNGITLLFKSWLYSTFLLVRGTLHTINVNRGDCVACVISKCA